MYLQDYSGPLDPHAFGISLLPPFRRPSLDGGSRVAK